MFRSTGPNWGNPNSDWKNGEPLLEVLAKEGRGCSLVASAMALRSLALGSADAITAEGPEESVEKVRDSATLALLHE